MATNEEAIKKFKELREAGIVQIYRKNSRGNSVLHYWTVEELIKRQKENPTYFDNLAMIQYIKDYINDPDDYILLKHNEALARNEIVKIGDKVVFQWYDEIYQGWIQKFSENTVHITIFEENIGKSVPSRYVNREFTYRKIWKL